MKHHSPETDRIRRYQGQEIRAWAHAPYNFIPLPETTVSLNKPPAQDSYRDGLKNGYVDCEITTLSPTYIRGMLDKDLYYYLKNTNTSEIAKDVNLKSRLAGFYSLAEDAKGFPCIPGSSLRGMLRNLVEIISFSRIHAVAKDPQIWYRDVANSGAMKDQYAASVGEHGNAIYPGILIKQGDSWKIKPCKLPGTNFVQSIPYFKVRENTITTKQAAGDLPGFISMYQSNYKLQEPYRILFNAEKKHVQQHNGITIEENCVTDLIAYKKGEKSSKKYQFSGWLVTTGNMVQRDPSHTSLQYRRHNYPVVLDGDQTAPELGIDEKAVDAYLSNLSDTISDQLGSQGCLRDGGVVFYSKELNINGKVIYFGHNPYFRVPLMKRNLEPVTPYDKIPPHLQDHSDWDLVEALFGNETEDEETDKTTCAGRVSFMDAKFTPQAGQNIHTLWYRNEREIAPALKVLGSAKPTAYAHYLVQGMREDPNTINKNNLAHYGTHTEIRGHKAYWTKGEQPDFLDKDLLPAQDEKLHTRARPLKPGVRFRCRIQFRNLRSYELGALLWALTLPVQEGKPTCCHRIGMGKPYGMGAIHIEPTLFIIDYKEKYQQAFTKQADGKIHWFNPAQQMDIKVFTDNFEKTFEKALKKAINFDGNFQDHPRIRDLLLMHTWRSKVDDAWRGETSYMELKQFKELAVLPTPGGTLEHAEKVRHRQVRGHH